MATPAATTSASVTPTPKKYPISRIMPTPVSDPKLCGARKARILPRPNSFSVALVGKLRRQESALS
jgi:hypothetical protein